jgi:signal transduction histidine kinase
VVMGSLEGLTDSMESKLSKKDSKLLELAYSSSHMLVQMVEDLLDISKIEERKVNLNRTRVAVRELVNAAVKQVGALAWREKVKLAVEVASDLPDLIVDKTRVVRVLVNLLNNAAQHTQAGGRISLQAAYQPVLKEVQFSVNDTGEGIPKEYHHRIFDKFAQVESAQSGKRPSSGLGLTYCKLATEAHGGSIWVDSEPGVGSTFTVTFPVY